MESSWHSPCRFIGLCTMRLSTIAGEITVKSSWDVAHIAVLSTISNFPPLISPANRPLPRLSYHVSLASCVTGRILVRRLSVYAIGLLQLSAPHFVERYGVCESRKHSTSGERGTDNMWMGIHTYAARQCNTAHATPLPPTNIMWLIRSAVCRHTHIHMHASRPMMNNNFPHI